MGTKSKPDIKLTNEEMDLIAEETANKITSIFESIMEPRLLEEYQKLNEKCDAIINKINVRKSYKNQPPRKKIAK